MWPFFSFETQFCFLLKWLKPKINSHANYQTVTTLRYDSEEPTTRFWNGEQVWMILTPILIFTSTSSVTRLRHSPMPEHLWLDFPAETGGVSGLSLTELLPLPLSPSNPVSLSTQVWEERGRCQCLGTFLRNGLQPQVGTEFPWHINDCYMKADAVSSQTRS